MPPTRSIPPAKAVKTERTHEENQERAYIAASRRSDRSLEARVESARRASEIHKRRTGRSLRVTEQDVQNEEMYEEEDDDLPLQYRRLTAHLQTGSADFNRRLSAYLTNHVAMRSALEQSIHNSYAQQFPNAPQYQASMFPSPMLAHQQQQQAGMMQPPQSPGMYRMHPYSSPQQHHQGFLTAQQRSNSIAVPQQDSSSSSTSNPASPVVAGNHQRSMSMSGTTTSVSHNSTSTSNNTISSRASTPSIQHNKPSFPPGSFSNPFQQPQFPLPTYDMGAFGQAVFPSFTTQLPAETQGFLGNALDMSDPLTSMMMAGSMPGNFWNFNQSFGMNNMGVGSGAQTPGNVAMQRGSAKPQEQQSSGGGGGGPQHAPSFAGLNATLAPASTLDDVAAAKAAIKEKSLSPKSSEQQVEKKEDVDEVSFGGVEEEDSTSNQELFFENAMVGKDGITPGLNGDSWDSWIHDASWDLAPTASLQ